MRKMQNMNGNERANGLPLHYMALAKRQQWRPTSPIRLEQSVALDSAGSFASLPSGALSLEPSFVATAIATSNWLIGLAFYVLLLALITHYVFALIVVNELTVHRGR